MTTPGLTEAGNLAKAYDLINELYAINYGKKSEKLLKYYEVEVIDPLEK